MDMRENVGSFNLSKVTIASYVSVLSSRYKARGKFGEHERCVSALQTSQVLHISMNAQLTYEPIVL